MGLQARPNADRSRCSIAGSMAGDRSRRQQTCGHMARFGKARLGYGANRRSAAGSAGRSCNPAGGDERHLYPGDGVRQPAGQPAISRLAIVIADTRARAATRRQLEDPARTAGLYFKREWCSVVDQVPADLDIVRYWDLAATEKTEFNDPDWTVGIKLGRDRSDDYWVLDMVRARANPGDGCGASRPAALKRARLVAAWSLSDFACCSRAIRRAPRKAVWASSAPPRA